MTRHADTCSSTPRDALLAPPKPGRSASAAAGWVAAVLVLCAGATWAQPAEMSHGRMMGPGPMAGAPGPMGGMGPMGAMGPMAPLLNGRLLDHIGASEAQKARIREIFQAAHREMATQHQAQRDQHRQIAQLLAAPQIDAQAIEALRQQLSSGHDAGSRRMMQAMIDASAVLTAEQRQKMAENMAQRQQMRERHRREMRTLDGGRG